MVKFWKMLIAMLAMMAMVVVPTSCGDDDDDDEKKENNNENNNDSNSSSNSIVGKVFVNAYLDIDEGFRGIQIYSFDEETVTTYIKDESFYDNPYRSEHKDIYHYIVLSDGSIKFDKLIDCTRDLNTVIDLFSHDDEFFEFGYEISYIYKDRKLYSRLKKGYNYEKGDYDYEYEEIGTEDKTGSSAELILNSWEGEALPSKVREESIRVVEGGVYTAKNKALGLDFTFRVTKVSGYYADKSQVVDLEVEYQGQKYQIELSDQGPSNLMWTATNGFEAVSMYVANANANRIVMVLRSDDADYTIASPTLNTKLFESGAVTTVFWETK